jgi:hypothetical protein
MAEQSVPKSSDPMVQKLSEFLLADLKTRSEGFCIQNEPLQPDEIASHDGLLSLFMYKASSNCEEAMRKKLPLYFESDSSALIDVVPMTEVSDLNLFSLWTHFMHFSVEEEVRRLKREKKLMSGLVPLDEMYKHWHSAISLQKYAVRPSSKTQPATRGS